MLEPATPNEIPNRIQSPPPPLEVQGELEYEISEILDSKIDRRHECKLLYLVRWLGYENTDEEYSWLPSTELEHASELISDFHSAYLTSLVQLLVHKPCSVFSFLLLRLTLFKKRKILLLQLLLF